MSYDPEELRAGIAELFDEAICMSTYRVEFGSLRSTGALRDYPQREPGINSIEAWEKQIATCLRRGYCICVRCGSRSPTHRCPEREEQ